MEHLKSQSKRHYWPLIDICKLYCALLVVVIHCLEIVEGHPTSELIVKCFSGQAVPFFMIASGFFFGNKLSKKETIKSNAWHYAKQLLFLYIAWTVLWLPYLIHTYLKREPGASFIHIAALLVRRIFFAGQGVYWYILVLAEAALIVALLVRYNKEKLLILLSVIGLILGFLYDANVALPVISDLNKIFYTVFSWSNNVIMKGIPFFATGYFIRKYGSNVKINKVLLAGIYGAACIIAVLLFRFDKGVYLILYPVQAISLFLFAIQPTELVNNGKFNTVCRELSSSVYFLHTVFIYGLVDLVWSVNAPILLKFAVSVGCSAVVYIIVKFSKAKSLCWLLNIKY